MPRITVEDHLAAVRAAIDRAGGPDKVRFAPIAIELLAQHGGEAKATEPYHVWFSGRLDDYLVDVLLRRPAGGLYALTAPMPSEH